MRRSKVKEPMSIISAMEILSSISELDKEYIEQEAHDPLHPARWVDISQLSHNEETIKDAMDAVICYLEHLHLQKEVLLDSEQSKKGILALVRILEEAKNKINRFTELFQQKFSDLAEYKRIRSLLTEILPEGIDVVVTPTETDLGLSSKKLSSLTKEELEDLQQIREDQNAEFFYLKREGGRAFYDYECIRRLKLLYDFEQMEEQEQVIRVRLLEAKEYQQRAIDLLQEVTPLLNDFRKEIRDPSANALASSLNKAVFALLCCANPRNLPSHSDQGKGPAEYFSDFVRYLREAMETKEYQKKGASSGNAERQLVSLVHKACFSFFVNLHAHKEVALFLRKLTQFHKGHGGSVSEELLAEDAVLRKTLENWPSGPLHRTIQAFLRGEIEQGWDPLLQGKIPSHIFTLDTPSKHIHILRMPAPVQQKNLQEAKVAKEFEIFLEKGLVAKKEKLLLIDLQDSTSMEEYARSHALHSLVRKEKLSEGISILQLAKKTGFYLQEEEYAKEDSAGNFIKHLQEQVLSGASCGFFFPKSFGKKELALFCEKASFLVHQVFFSQKKKLSQRERQDFIEIFYFLLIAKGISVESPDYIAFVSKDGLDRAVSTAADLFSA